MASVYFNEFEIKYSLQKVEELIGEVWIRC